MEGVKARRAGGPPPCTRQPSGRLKAGGYGEYAVGITNDRNLLGGKSPRSEQQ